MTRRRAAGAIRSLYAVARCNPIALGHGVSREATMHFTPQYHRRGEPADVWHSLQSGPEQDCEKVVKRAKHFRALTKMRPRDGIDSVRVMSASGKLVWVHKSGKRSITNPRLVVV